MPAENYLVLEKILEIFKDFPDTQKVIQNLTDFDLQQIEFNLFKLSITKDLHKYIENINNELHFYLLNLHYEAEIIRKEIILQLQEISITDNINENQEIFIILTALSGNISALNYLDEDNNTDKFKNLCKKTCSHNKINLAHVIALSGNVAALQWLHNKNIKLRVYYPSASTVMFGSGVSPIKSETVYIEKNILAIEGRNNSANIAHFAAISQNLSSLQWILNNYPSLFFSPNKIGLNVAHYVAGSRDNIENLKFFASQYNGMLWQNTHANYDALKVALFHGKVQNSLFLLKLKINQVKKPPSLLARFNHLYNKTNTLVISDLSLLQTFCKEILLKVFFTSPLKIITEQKYKKKLLENFNKHDVEKIFSHPNPPSFILQSVNDKNIFNYFRKISPFQQYYQLYFNYKQRKELIKFLHKNNYLDLENKILDETTEEEKSLLEQDKLSFNIQEITSTNNDFIKILPIVILLLDEKLCLDILYFLSPFLVYNNAILIHERKKRNQKNYIYDNLLSAMKERNKLKK